MLQFHPTTYNNSQDSNIMDAASLTTYQKVNNNDDDLIEEENSLEKNDLISDKHSGYFFTFLNQPLDWRLPIFSIHLSKSDSGHVGIKEAIDIQKLLFKINSHPHQAICNKYSMMIKDVLAGKITLDDFIDEVYTICSIIPILDVLHDAKSGISRIMNAPMKLGNSCDLIDVNTLKIYLELNNNVLNDKTTLGKMKDVYPLNLEMIKSQRYFTFLYILY